jgi:hypothetical protein
VWAEETSGLCTHVTSNMRNTERGSWFCNISLILTQNFGSDDGVWQSGLMAFCLSSGILKNTALRKLDLFPSSGEGVRDTYFIWSV